MRDVSDAPVDPRDVVPGYETDLRAVGRNRQVADGLEDEVPWHEVHPELAAELGMTAS